MTVDAHIELEFKLQADGAGPSVGDVVRAAATAGIELEERPRIKQRDTYFDDRALRLSRAGVGLRLRETKRRSTIGVKSERGSERGAFRRDELELPFDGPLPSRSSELPDPIRDRIEPLVLNARLRQVARLLTRRRILRAAGLEVALDLVEVEDASGATVAQFAELEIEVLDPVAEATARRLADALRVELDLRNATSNKLRHALQLLRVHPDPDAKRAVGPDTPIAEAVRRIMHRFFRRMQREEVRTRTTDSTAAVHKLRVACRRLRAALRTFEPWIPARDRKAIRSALRSTAGGFADARNIDVLAEGLQARTERLPEQLREPAGQVIARLRRRGKAARGIGRTALRDPKRIDALARLQEFVETPPPADDASPAVRAVAPGLIRTAAAEAFAHGRSLGPRSPAEAVHRLRILMKRLRYTAEFFVDAYGKDLVRFIDRTTHIQEILGDFNDAMVAVDTLDELATRPRALPRALLPAVGALTAVEYLRALDARGHIDETWSEFDCPDVRTWLEAVLRSPTPAAGAADPAAGHCNPAARRFDRDGDRTAGAPTE